MNRGTAINKALPTDAGCWIDGHWGHYANQRLLAIASCYGFRYAPIDFENPDEDTFEAICWEADRAEEWLNDNITPDGFSFGWHDGEFFLWSNEDWEQT